MITIRRQIEVEAVMMVVIPTILALLYVINRNNYKQQFNVVLNMPIAKVEADTESKIVTTSQISPDGKKKVIMKTTRNQDSTSTYELLTSDEDGKNEQYIFTKILDQSKEIIIPFNTWSPDNKYFFVQEDSGKNKNIFIFKATGGQFANGEVFLDATESFRGANTGNIFREATGWASETLIIINSIKENGEKGPSYWFEVPNKAVIMLSTEF